MIFRRMTSVLIVLFLGIAFIGCMIQPTAQWLLYFAAGGVVCFCIRIMNGDD